MTKAERDRARELINRGIGLTLMETRSYFTQALDALDEKDAEIERLKWLLENAVDVTHKSLINWWSPDSNWEIEIIKFHRLIKANRYAELAG